MEATKIKSFLVIVIILVAIFSFLSINYVPIHSIYNSNWNGASDLRVGLESLNFTISRFLISPIIFNSNTSAKIIVIIGSERTYTSAEVQVYDKFVKNGGTLVIFEDFGPARKIVESFGVSYFAGMVKESTKDLYINRPSQIFINDLIIPQLFDGVSLPPLMASEAAGIFDYSGFQQGTTIPILVSFPSAFLDTNKNDVIDSSDLAFPTGIPMGIYKKVGNGSLIAISDSSIPLNQYWRRNVVLSGKDFILSNALWCTLVIGTMASLANSTNIIFDESHQNILLTSSAGILNAFFGTWIGVINSIITTGVLAILLFSYTYVNLKRKFKHGVRIRTSRGSQTELEDWFISHPSYAERTISEQYILFEIMKDNFVQVANSDLIKKLEKTGKADEFLKELRQKYGDLQSPRSLSELLDIHIEMRNYVDSQINKWL